MKYQEILRRVECNWRASPGNTLIHFSLFTRHSPAWAGEGRALFSLNTYIAPSVSARTRRRIVCLMKFLLCLDNTAVSNFCGGRINPWRFSFSFLKLQYLALTRKSYWRPLTKENRVTNPCWPLNITPMAEIALFSSPYIASKENKGFYDVSST